MSHERHPDIRQALANWMRILAEQKPGTVISVLPASVNSKGDINLYLKVRDDAWDKYRYPFVVPDEVVDDDVVARHCISVPDSQIATPTGGAPIDLAIYKRTTDKIFAVMTPRTAEA